MTARTGAAIITLSAELDGGSLTTTGPGTDVTIGRPGQNARLRFEGTAGQRMGLGFTASTLGSGLFAGLPGQRAQARRDVADVLVAAQRRRRRHRRAGPAGERNV